MKDLNYYVNKIGSDKVIHGLVTFVIASNVAILDYEIFNRPAIIAAVVGAITAIIVSIGKELIDFFKNKSFDLSDLKFNFIGLVLGSIWSLILMYI